MGSIAWSVLIALAVGTLAGLGISVIYAPARRYARGSRELGTDDERATFETLNLASRAATHLRGGLLAGDPARAARYLRVLLSCEVLVIVDERGAIAVDGGSDRVRASAERLAQAARQSGRVELSRAAVHLEHGERDGVAAPIVIRGRSIGAIVAFITTDPPKARDLVLEFADFTRYSFRRDGDFTTIAEELGSVDSCLKLERARFGDRISVTLRIAPEVLGTVIPFLSVQPLVENAVRHGLESTEGGGHITITAEDSGSYAQITVEDDGVGIDPEVLRDVLAGRPSTGHIALRNVDSRLRQVYGNAHRLVVETNVNPGTLVTMRVPKSQPDHLAGQEQGR